MFLLVDKPARITSHDVVDRLRKITGIKKIGHAGTLDPFATGLLIVAVSRESTKRLGEFLKSDKTYDVTAVLGATSDTGDSAGTINQRSDITSPSLDDVVMTLQKFLSPQTQIPPMYSAKKIAGQKLYELARQGKTVERQPQAITIHNLTLLEYHFPTLRFTARVSSGTYIRTLVEDIGATLGCGGYTDQLRRTAIGPHDIGRATRLDDITPDTWTTASFAA